MVEFIPITHLVFRWTWVLHGKLIIECFVFGIVRLQVKLNLIVLCFRLHGVCKENPLAPLIGRLGLPLYRTSGDNSVLYDHDLERYVIGNSSSPLLLLYILKFP